MRLIHQLNIDDFDTRVYFADYGVNNANSRNINCKKVLRLKNVGSLAILQELSNVIVSGY